MIKISKEEFVKIFKEEANTKGKSVGNYTEYEYYTEKMFLHINEDSLIIYGDNEPVPDVIYDGKIPEYDTDWMTLKRLLKL